MADLVTRPLERRSATRVSPSLVANDEAALGSTLARQLQARGYRVDLLIPALRRLAAHIVAG